MTTPTLPLRRIGTTQVRGYAPDAGRLAVISQRATFEDAVPRKPKGRGAAVRRIRDGKTFRFVASALAVGSDDPRRGAEHSRFIRATRRHLPYNGDYYEYIDTTQQFQGRLNMTENATVKRCSKCGSEAVIVIDSRQASAGTEVRRRRECEACKHRWTTYEMDELRASKRGAKPSPEVVADVRRIRTEMDELLTKLDPPEDAEPFVYTIDIGGGI